MYKVLVVEDEKDISNIVCKYLEKENYEYDLADNGFDALELFNANKYHLVLLDIMMDGIDGLEVIKRIRDISDVPVLMTTAKVEEADRIKGFDLGADDYVVKPYSPRELMRRINVFIKRVYTEQKELSVENIVLNTENKTLYKDSKEVKISSLEYRIIECFMTNINKVLSREQIIEMAFSDFDGYDRSIDTYIRRIRKKIESDPNKPQLLQTKYGLGYIMKDKYEKDN
jgi:DNA-binding response OmpR family regulator